MNLKYHIHTSSVKCPYCDNDNEDCDHEVNSEDPIEFECEHCHKIFHAEMNYVYTTYSDCGLNHKEHEWYNSESNPTVFHCKNCSQYKVI